MPRQPILALGLVALALGLGTVARRVSRRRAARAGGQGRVQPPPRWLPDEAEHRGHEGEEASPTSSKPEPSLAIWTVVVFLGLLFVLGRFAWKPLLAALHQREEHLEHVLLETERARNESEQLLAEHRRQLEQAAETGPRPDRARPGATRRPAPTRSSTKAQAEAEAERQRAERDIATARDQALVEIWSKTADLAVSVAGRVLAKQIDERSIAAWSRRRSASCRPSRRAQRARAGGPDRMSAANGPRRRGDGLRRRDARGDAHVCRGAARRRREGGPGRGRARRARRDRRRRAPGASPVRRAAGLAGAGRRRRRTASSSRRSRAGPCRSSSGSSGCSTGTAGSGSLGRDRAGGPGDLGPPAEPPAGHGPLGRPARRRPAGRAPRPARPDARGDPGPQRRRRPRADRRPGRPGRRRRLRRLGPQPARTAPPSTDRREDA